MFFDIGFEIIFLVASVMTPVMTNIGRGLLLALAVACGTFCQSNLWMSPVLHLSNCSLPYMMNCPGS